MYKSADLRQVVGSRLPSVVLGAAGGATGGYGGAKSKELKARNTMTGAGFGAALGLLGPMGAVSSIPVGYAGAGSGWYHPSFKRGLFTKDQDEVKTAAFVDELEKIAGVGWRLHGYSTSPESYDSEWSKAKDTTKAFDSDLEKSVGKAPSYHKPRGFFGKLFNRPKEKNPEYDDYSTRVKEYMSTREYPMEDYDVRDKYRIKTPYDDRTNYKLNLNQDVGTDSSISEYTTDHAYSDKPITRNLSREELAEVARRYKAQMANYRQKDPSIAAAQQAFLDKAKWLMDNEKSKFYRLEYE